MKRSVALALSLLSFAAFGQTATTHCLTTAGTPAKGISIRLLVACAPEFSENTLWHLDRIDQTSPSLNGRAYRGNGGAGSVIYVVDSGVYAEHSEFMTPTGSRVIGGIRIAHPVENACPTADPVLAPCGDTPVDYNVNTQGTAVASIAAGKTVGVAPEAWVVAVKAWDPFYFPTSRDMNDTLDAIIQHAYDFNTPPFNTAIVIIGESVGTEEAPVTFAAVTAKMRMMANGVDREGNPDPNGKRFFFTVPVGNSGFNIWCDAAGTPKLWPGNIGAATDGIVIVGGTSRDADTIWSGSCRNAELYAPAEHLLAAMMSGNNHYSGTIDSTTTWAAPIVAGIAARMLELNPQLTPVQIEARLVVNSIAVGSSGAKMPLFLAPPPRGRSVRH